MSRTILSHRAATRRAHPSAAVKRQAVADAQRRRVQRAQADLFERRPISESKLSVLEAWNGLATAKAKRPAHVQATEPAKPLAPEEVFVRLSPHGAALLHEVGVALETRAGQAFVEELRDVVYGSLPTQPTKWPPALLACALIRLLWRSRNDDRRLRAMSCENPALRRLLRELSREAPPTRPDYRFLAEVLHLACAKPSDGLELARTLVHDRLIPHSLDVVDKVKRRIPHEHFKDRGLILSIHGFVSMWPVLRAVMDKGMATSNICILFTPYGDNPLVAAYAILHGMHVGETIDRGIGTAEIELWRLDAIHRFAGAIVTSGISPKKGWTLFDDGALVHGVINGWKPEPNRWPLFSSGFVSRLSPEVVQTFFSDAIEHGGEQTRRGSTELERRDTPYRITHLSNLESKKLEGDVIAQSLARPILERLARLEHLTSDHALSPFRILIAGAGTVGRPATRTLSGTEFQPNPQHSHAPINTRIDARLIDADPEAVERATMAGLPCTQGEPTEATVAGFDMLLPVTGKHSVVPETFGNADPILANGGSMTVEFCPIELGRTRSRPPTVWNRGRPLNMEGDGYENVPPENIAATRAGMLGVIAGPDRMSAAALKRWERRLDRTILRAWKPVPPQREPRPDPMERPDKHLKPFTQRGAPPHTFWMTFLMNSDTSVLPYPPDVGFASGYYFFRDEVGSIRVVDTAYGYSASTSLHEMPMGSTPLGQPTESHPLLLEYGAPNPRVEIFDPRFGEVVRSLAHAQMLAYRYSPHDYYKRDDRGRLFLSASVLLEGKEGELMQLTEPQNLEKPARRPTKLYEEPAAQPIARCFHKEEDTLLFIEEKILFPPRILQIRKEPAAIGSNSILGDPILPGAFQLVANAFRRIEGVFKQPQTGRTFVFGINHEGRRQIAPLDHNDLTPRVFVLPEGASFRRLESVGNSEVGQDFEIYVHRAGEKDDLSHHTKIAVKFPKEFGLLQRGFEIRDIPLNPIKAQSG